MEAAFLQISTKSGTDEDMMNAPGMDGVRGRWITPIAVTLEDLFCCPSGGEISTNFLPSAWSGFDRSDVH